MNKETLSTSVKEVPKIKLALEEKYEEENKTLPPETEPLSPENIGVETVDELPEPSGYRILVLPFTPKTKSSGGILFSQETLDKARIATTCGYDLKILGVKKEIGLFLLVMRVQDYRLKVEK